MDETKATRWRVRQGSLQSRLGSRQEMNASALHAGHTYGDKHGNERMITKIIYPSDIRPLGRVEWVVMKRGNKYARKVSFTGRSTYKCFARWADHVVTDQT